MQLKTDSSFATPDTLVFVENFELSLEDEGHVVRCKSKLFASLAKRIRSSPEPITVTKKEQHDNQFPFLLEGKPFWIPSATELGTTLSCLNPYQPSLVNRDAEIVANMSFLMLEGLEEGVEVFLSVPISTVDALDYYHCCLQAFQQLYVEWLRPYKASSTLAEVLT